MTWPSSFTMGSCPECCGGGGCPCDTSLFPSTLHVAITKLTGTCDAMTGSGMAMNYISGATWQGTGFGTGTGSCPPDIQCDFSCVNVSGTYVFQISMAWSPDLAAGGTATVVNCGPPVDIEFTLNLVWSGFNGSTLCCDPGPDTGTSTIIGTIKVVVSP